MTERMIPKNLAALYIDIPCGECGRLVALSNTIQYKLKYYCPRCANELEKKMIWFDEDKEVTDEDWEVLLKGVNNLENLKDELSRDLYNMTREEAWDKGICIQCKGTALDKCYSEAGREEYQISALCERCFDSDNKEGENDAG